MKQNIRKFAKAASVMMVLMLGVSQSAQAVIEGITGGGISGSVFNLEAKTGYISTADGNSQYVWGFANANTGVNSVTMQYPGPTLIVDEGDTVTVNLNNSLPVPVSIIFPGQSNVSSSTTLFNQDGDVTR